MKIAKIRVHYNWQAKQYTSSSIIITFFISFVNIDTSVEVGSSFLPELPKMLIITHLEFCLPIFDFHLKTLAKCFFFFNIFSIVFKKSSRFLIKSFFQMRFEVISYCYLALNFFLVSFIDLGDIRNKKISRYL